MFKVTFLTEDDQTAEFGRYDIIEDALAGAYAAMVQGHAYVTVFDPDGNEIPI